jgi:hypothetical protein
MSPSWMSMRRKGTAVGPSVLHRPALYAYFPKWPTPTRLATGHFVPLGE